MSNALQQDPVGLLLNLINAKTGSTLTKTNVIVNAPTRVESRDRNTSLVINYLPGSGKLGRLTVYYNRIHVSALGVVRAVRNQAVMVSELLGAISNTKGVAIAPADIIDAFLPPKVGSEGKVELSLLFSESSWLWYSGAMSSSVALPPAQAVPPGAGNQLGNSCTGWSILSNATNGSGGITEVVLDPYSVLCGWDPGTSQKRTGWLRFAKRLPTAQTGQILFKELI